MVAGLSLGLSYTDILDMEISLLLGLLNEKNNQLIGMNKKQDVIQGDANMLMNM